ncbi:hypothetical protein IWW48_004803 [Coemansia sp. RSA 1200]|nr:hypothetical protein IWW48_004803 [Coemansia sp. RSA 1200]
MRTGKTSESPDEGIDDCSPPTHSSHQRYQRRDQQSQQQRRHAATDMLHQPAQKEEEEDNDDISLAESLAFTLKASVSADTCTRLAVQLLSHVPPDMLKAAIQRLDLLLRRDFIGMLPLEISTRILEFVPTMDIVRNAMLVSRKWHAATIQPCLWRKIFHRQGWGIDKERWTLYCSLPSGLTPTRALLGGSMMQVSKAISGSGSTVAESSNRFPTMTGLAVPVEIPGSRIPAAVVRQTMLTDEDRNLVQETLMLDTRSPMEQHIDSLSTVTAQAMALGLALQPARRQRRVVNTLGSPDRYATVNRVSTSVPTEPFGTLADRTFVGEHGNCNGKNVVATFTPGATSSAATSRLGDVLGSARQQSYRQQQQHWRQASSGAAFSLPGSVTSSPYAFTASPRQGLTLSPCLQNQRSRMAFHGGSSSDKKQIIRPRATNINWRRMYGEYHQLLDNWRGGRCRVDRWESAHAESIYTLQFDKHNRLFTGSRDCTVKLWHLSETGSQITPLATLRGHTGSVLTLQADGNTLISGSSDGRVCVWDTDTYTIAYRLEHPDSVLSLRFNSTWLATACKDRVVRVWRRSGGYTDTFELRGHTVAINAVHLHGNTLVSASGDRTIKVWNLVTRSCVMTLEDHARGVACLDFDGSVIASGSSDRSIRVWDAATGVCQRVIPNAHSDLVRTVMVNRRMDILVSGSYDESIKIWSLSTGTLIHKIKNVHTSRVFKLMFDRSRIVSCSHDRSVSIIDFATELPHARLLL